MIKLNFCLNIIHKIYFIYLHYFHILMRRVYFVALLLFIAVTVFAQEKLLPDVIRSSKNEYSGMCLYEGKVFLLPQSKKPGTPFSGHINSIDTRKISLDKDMRLHVPDEALRTYTFTNLPELASAIPGFEGFEAISIYNNTVFLTVETETDNDYIVKGYLHDTLITLSEKRVWISKPRRNAVHLTNAGLEGMALFRGSLVIAFEYNYFGLDAAFLYKVDTSFHKLPGANTPFAMVPFQALPFRLTDMCPSDHGTFYAINHYWNFNGNMNHKEAYYKDIDPSKDPDLKHWTPGECFTRIIELKPTANGFTWKTKKVIPNNQCINWEGIVPYKDGVLLISDDNKIPFLETKLHYYSFK